MVPLNDAELLALVVVSGDKRMSEDGEYSRERERERCTVGSDIYEIICQVSVCKPSQRSEPEPWWHNIVCKTA